MLRTFLAALVSLSALAWAGGGADATGSAGTRGTTPARPVIVQTGADTIAFVRPAASDTWVLSGTSLVKEIALVNLATGRTATTVGVDTGARAVATSANGALAVAGGRGTSGILDLYRTATGRLVAEVALPGPALAVISGGRATSFWVIEQIGGARVVANYSSTGTQLGPAVPVSRRLVDIAVFPDQSALWGLLANGTMQQIELPSGHVTTSFGTGQAATALALSPSGGTAYVLRSAIAAPNVAQVNLTKEADTAAFPAPAHSFDIVVSANGRTLYVAASTHRFGNIQAIELRG